MTTNSQVCATLTAQFKDDYDDLTGQWVVIRDFEMSGSFETLLEEAQDWGSISNPGHTYYVEEFQSPHQVYGHIHIFRTYAELMKFLRERCSEGKSLRKEAR
jgi:hypothetical protein